MPNWCSNLVTIHGPVADVTSALDNVHIDDLVFSFDAVTPTPQTSKPDGTSEPADNWYEFRIENWGTKWQPDVTITRDTSDGTTRTVVLAMDTAWSPPLALFDTWAQKHPGLAVTIEFDEPGMDFGGVATWRGGTHHVTWSTSPSNIANAFGVTSCVGDDRVWLTRVAEHLAGHLTPLNPELQEHTPAQTFAIDADLARRLMGDCPAWWSREQIRGDLPDPAILVSVAQACHADVTGWLLPGEGVEFTGLRSREDADPDSRARLLAAGDGLQAHHRSHLTDPTTAISWTFTRWDADEATYLP